MLVRKDALIRLALISAITAASTLFAQNTTRPATMPATAPATAPATQPAAPVVPPAAAAPVELPPITQAFVATITDNRVNVRSGPGTAYYEIGQLAKGDLVYIVGASKDWYKILPPNGTFCMIAKEYLEPDPNGAPAGTVKGDYINVRAGTAANKNRDPSAVLAVVRKGTRLKILGATDQYYQVAPPEQAYVYISSQYIKAAPGTEYKVAELKLPGGAANPFAATVDAPTAPPTLASATSVPGAPSGLSSTPPSATIDIPSTPGATMVTPGATTETPGAVSSTPPSALPTSSAVPATPTAEVPTVVPAITFSAAARTRFNEANARYLEESKKQLSEQDAAKFTKEFQDILAMENVSPTVSQGAQANIKALERVATLQRLMKEQAAAAEATKRQTDALKLQLDASQKLLEASRATAPYINEGVLKSSTIVAGKYALVDPATNRVVAYIDPASSAIDMSIFMNRYIGVRGDKKKGDGGEIEVITVRDATLMPPPSSPQ